MNLYDEITRRIMEQLEQGMIPWRKPWIGSSSAISHVTGKPYSLLNQMLLGRPGEYVTFRQCQQEGGMVRKGEKSSMVVFWKWIEQEDEESGEKKSIPFLRYYRRVVWRCNRKYDGDQPCGTPHFDEETLKQLFLSALNKLVGKRNEIRDSFDVIRSTVFSTDALEAELAQVEAEMSIAAEQVARSIRENAMVALDQSAYRARHDALCDRYESLKVRCAELKETISDKQTRLAAIDDFLRTLMKQETLPTTFDPMTYHILVERMTVYGKDKVIVRFKNGMEIQA